MLAEKYLLKNNLIEEQDIGKITLSVENKVKSAFNFAEESPFPDRKEALKGIYCEDIS
jgi:TPP-dependent pyruvate/acetoin dehydrogenase alpha subunit